MPAGPPGENEPAGSPPPPEETKEQTGIEEFLLGLSKKQLIAMILHLCDDIPQVGCRLQDASRNRQTGHAALRKELHREIRRVNRIDPWSDPWSGRGNLPDYSSVRRKMRALLDAGGFAEALAEGGELLRLGKEQIERSSDEGETRDEIAGCVPLLREALRASALPAADKLLWALEAVLEDDYGICDPLQAFLEETHPPEAWSLAADNLAARLDALPVPQSRFAERYQRNAVCDWLIHALERCGREEAILPLCEREAKTAGNYARLIIRLMRNGRDAEALQWVREGLRNTEKNATGLVCGLLDLQREIYARQGDWPSLLVLEVEEFVRNPDVASFVKCRKAADANANAMWDAVRRALLGFLISGGMPWESGEWPAELHVPGVMAGVTREKTVFPMLPVLIGIAIHEKLPEDVARWYAMLSGTYGGNFFHDKAATAMRERFPEQSVAIWERLVENAAALTMKSAYQEAGGYLRKMRDVMRDGGRQEEWTRYVASLRARHRRKKLFLEVLDALDEKPLLKR